MILCISRRRLVIPLSEHTHNNVSEPLLRRPAAPCSPLLGTISMKSMRLAIGPLLSLFTFVTIAHAQESIRFGRTPDISPDAKLVAFSYLGDIWVVNAIGGVARPVTMHEAHDIYPAFSPDGRKIAFSSNRH